MRNERALHAAQVSILHALRHETSARFNELLKRTSLTSDVFKFHIRKLITLQLLQKVEDGSYELTAMGKDFANRLDETTGLQIVQPKSSLLLLVKSGDYYLAHRRTREPFRDFWGIASAPIVQGVPIVSAAHDEFFKQTGIEAQFSAQAMYRVIDRTHSGTILEDKLFSVMIADVKDCPAPHTWPGGESEWLTREQILSKSPLFPTTAKLFDRLDQGIVFAEDICEYDTSDY